MNMALFLESLDADEIGDLIDLIKPFMKTEVLDPMGLKPSDYMECLEKNNIFYFSVRVRRSISFTTSEYTDSAVATKPMKDLSDKDFLKCPNLGHSSLDEINESIKAVKIYKLKTYTK